MKRDPILMMYQRGDSNRWGHRDAVTTKGGAEHGLDDWAAAFAMMRRARGVIDTYRGDLGVGGRVMVKEWVHAAMEALDAACTDMLSEAPWLTHPSIDDLMEAAA